MYFFLGYSTVSLLFLSLLYCRKRIFSESWFRFSSINPFSVLAYVTPLKIVSALRPVHPYTVHRVYCACKIVMLSEIVFLTHPGFYLSFSICPPFSIFLTIPPFFLWSLKKISITSERRSEKEGQACKKPAKCPPQGRLKWVCGSPFIYQRLNSIKQPIYERGEIAALSDRRIYHSWETRCCSYLSNTVPVSHSWWHTALPTFTSSEKLGASLVRRQKPFVFIYCTEDT